MLSHPLGISGLNWVRFSGATHRRLVALVALRPVRRPAKRRGDGIPLRKNKLNHKNVIVWGNPFIESVISIRPTFCPSRDELAKVLRIAIPPGAEIP